MNDVMRRLIAVGVTFMGPLCATTTAQSGSSWTQTALVQRAHAGALLENMAGRIRANSEHAEEYVAANIGVGPPQTCENALTLAALDVCEWANLLRSAGEAQKEEPALQLSGARGCISRPAPSLYVISIAWDGAVLSEPAGANCESREFRAERALLTVVRVAQDS